MGDIYVHQALASLNSQPNPVLNKFFSDNNMSLLQNKLRYQVLKNTNNNISNQSCTEIYTVMKYVYVNNVKIVYTNFKPEIDRLNDLVLIELVPMVCSNILQHIQYIKDINTLPTPIKRGQSTSTKGDNSLEFQKF